MNEDVYEKARTLREKRDAERESRDVETHELRKSAFAFEIENGKKLSANNERYVSLVARNNEIYHDILRVHVRLADAAEIQAQAFVRIADALEKMGNRS